MERILARPHVQGDRSALELSEGETRLTDAAGLLQLRSLVDELKLGAWLDAQEIGGQEQYRVSLMAELWCALLLYGGSHMDHLEWVEGRGLRELFGWESIPDPTTFGRWLKRYSDRKLAVVEEALRRVVLARWGKGVPKSVMLILDATVVLRYGKKQAGAEVGYNPKKKGRPSHHPLVAFLSTGDCLGVKWRAGKSNCAAGSADWITELVAWLRSAGVEEITVRLDKGFFSQAMAQHLEKLGVKYVLKVQESQTMQERKGAFVQSEQEPRFWSSEGQSWGFRLLSVEEREKVGAAEGELELETYKMVKRATMLTNIEGIDAYEAWALYNAGAVVEHRIEELTQLSVGRTAVDDLDGNALLWALGALAYQLMHTLRTRALPPAWQSAQPKRLRAWLFRMPAKLVRHARRWTVQLSRGEPLKEVLLGGIRSLQRDRELALAM
jgi:hypothetical protein